MSKQYKIKWTDVDEKAARAEIKRYNQRIDYQRKKNPQNAEFLPAKISMKEFKADIATRKDFTKKLKSLKAFKADTAKVVTNVYGEKATVYAIEETKKNVKSVNAKRAAQARKINESAVYVKGKKLENVQRMADVEKFKPVKFDFNKAKKGEFAKFAARFEEYATEKFDFEKTKIYRDTMIEVFYRVFGKDDGDTLVEMLKNIPFDVIHELVSSGIDEFSLLWQSNEPIDENAKFDRIYNILKENQPETDENED